MEYALKKTIESPSFTIRVYSPIIGAEERHRRIQTIHRSAEELLKTKYKRKNERN